MAVMTFPDIPRLSALLDLQIHQVALKCFHYHDVGEFPYNLLITVLSAQPGSGNYFKNCATGTKVHLRPGHAYLLPCHVPVRYERTPAVTVVTMRFNLTFCYGVDIFRGATEIAELPAPELISFLRQNHACGERENMRQIRDIFQLKTLVSALCVACWPERHLKLSLRMLKYEEVFRYVQECGDARLSIGKLAELCGMRQDVFSRAFKRDAGVSPKQYINDVLVRKISAMLLASGMTLKEIAADLNFASEYYLSRFFKAQTKLSPRNYHRSILSDTDHESVSAETAPARE